MLMTSQEQRQIPHADVADADRGVDLLSLAAAFVAQRRFALTIFASVFALCVIYILTLKPQYLAGASFVPEEQRLETGSLASLVGSGNSNSLYLGLLSSRSVKDIVIENAHLMDLFHTKSREQARSILDGKSTFKQTPDGIITILIRDKSANDAALIANAYLDGLEHLNEQMALQQNRELRDIFQKQLEEQRAELEKSEAQFEQIEQQTGVVEPAAQTQIGLTAIAGIRSQIAALDVQLASLLQGETESNPQVQRVRSQIAQLRAQEATLVNGSKTPMGAAPPTGQLPQTNLDFQRAQRQLTYHSEALNALTTQYEQAQLNGARTRPGFQIIDSALPPEHKAWPPRKAYFAFSAVLAFLVSIIAVVVRLVFRRILNDPENQQGLAELRNAVRKA